MLKNKLFKIDSIQDEVRDFHPILHKLLPRLPRVNSVEYTHGVYEMGADFVLAKQDDIFKEVEYVGVIAKVRKIHQDYGDIERQIEECSVSRKYFGGEAEHSFERNLDNGHRKYHERSSR